MTTNIQAVRSVGNPQRAFEFEVEILGSAAGGNEPVLVQRVESVSIPATSLEVIEINHRARKSHHAGRTSSPHTVVVNFWDSEDQEVYKFIRGWINKIQNEAIHGGVTKDLYAGQMNIHTYAHDSNTITNTVTLTHVWPSECGEVSLDYSNSEHFKFAVTFSYDTNITE